MSDQPDEESAVPGPADDVAERVDEQHDSADEEFSAPGRVATGHPAVDEVLRSLDGLEARPVDEHVNAFERAHEVLRRALSDAGDEEPGDDTVSHEA
jgi:hypothetical protein